MKAVVRTNGQDLTVDLSSPVSLALELDFDAAQTSMTPRGSPTPSQPRHFGAPLATSRPYALPGFSGSVETGAGCNCNVITVIPHCNGTHTECAGHLTREPFDAYRVVPLGPVEALLLSVTPARVGDESASGAQWVGETTNPTPRQGDRLVTRQALESAWARHVLSLNQPSLAPRALVIRTRYGAVNPVRADGANTPPYLTREAARLLVDRGIDHLVIDLPSIDREHDEGRLTAHRAFFGLPPGSRALAHVTRKHATVTELARIPDHLEDGRYLLELQVPAWRGDAVPSRPLLYVCQHV